MKQNILFVCGRNKWRSPTAERIYKNDQRLNVRSAGVSSISGHTINEKDILWATLILVFDSKYKKTILDTYCRITLPKIECLDIPDEYPYMDEELINLITASVEQYIE